MMRKLYVIGLMVLVAVPSFADSVSFGGNGSGSVSFGGKGSGSVSFQSIPAFSVPPINVEFVSPGDTQTNVISSSESVTCSANTKLLVIAMAYRRNNGQVINGVTYAGRNCHLGSNAPTNVRIDTAWYYLQNPPAGTANSVVTLSGSTPGFTQSSIGFQNSTTAPDAANDFTSASIATSSTSVTPVSVNDIAVSVFSAYDASLGTPVLNTSAATQRILRTYASAGNGGWFGVATSTVTVDPAVINWSVPSATAIAHSWFSVNP